MEIITLPELPDSLKRSSTFVIFVQKMVPIDLSDTVAVVTGGSGGIGSEIARVLAVAGSHIAVCYHLDGKGAAKTVSQCGPKAIAVQGDLSDAKTCRRVVDDALNHFGKIDFLINNAAIGLKDSLQMNHEEWTSVWSDTLGANLLSTVHMTFHCVPHMKRRGGGKIINIASRSAFRAETEYMAYAASKAAMVNFTRSIARALASDNILAYAVAPGFIEAGMGLEEIAKHGAAIRSQIPSGKIGTPLDVANAVLFLASNLSNYMTGSTLDVNGGSYLH